MLIATDYAIDKSPVATRSIERTASLKSQRNRRLVAFAGGGTGGHLYPALSIAAALLDGYPDVRVKFFASDRPVDRDIIENAGHEWIAQRLPRVTMSPLRWYAECTRLVSAKRRCLELFSADPPDIVVGSGGMAAYFPVALGAKRGIPTVLINPDALPGRANRLLAQRARVVFVQWPEAARLFGQACEVRVSGCPVRPAFYVADCEAGRRTFDLDPSKRTLLVTGASQGARTVNDAVVHALPCLRRHPDWQVLHLTGATDCERLRLAYSGADICAHVVAFTHDMAHALAAADLVLTRGGASTLAEITTVGRASIVMPYPFHRDMHQRANAQCLANHSRGAGAVVLEDKKDGETNAQALAPILEDLMTDDKKRTAMAAVAAYVGSGNAAKQIAQELHAMLPQVAAHGHGN